MQKRTIKDFLPRKLQELENKTRIDLEIELVPLCL